MRKLIVSLIVAASAWTAVQAQAPISSVNAAGYIKYSCEKGKFYFLQIPFNKFDGSPYTIPEVAGTSLPNGSKVFKWNTTTSSYVIFTYLSALNIWTPTNGDQTLERGDGFFVQVPAGAANPSYDIFLYGEVPGATAAATTALPLQNGFNAYGFPYPVATTVENSGLTAITAPGDKVFIWDPNAGYTITTRTVIPSFPWNPANRAIAAGQAFFVQVAALAPNAFVSTVPYSWPNN